MTGPAWLGFLTAAGLGATARHLLDGWVQRRAGASFPWGTLAVNISGCLAAGVLAGLGMHHGLGGTARTVLGTGGLGAYTTFSTFTYDTVRLAGDGRLDLAVRNIAANMVVGLAAAAVGLAATSAL